MSYEPLHRKAALGEDFDEIHKFGERKYIKNFAWLLKLKKGKYTCLLEYLRDNPMESLVELDDGVEVEHLIFNIDQRLVFIEFDARLRDLIYLYQR